jgi:serine/threonine protein kinase
VSQSLIHLDLTPENVLLTSDLDARIADLGLAILTEDEGTVKQTHVGGTAGFKAPEVASGSFSEKADIYSLAMTFFDMAAGRQGISGRSVKPTLPNMDADDPCAPLRPSSEEDAATTGPDDDRRDVTTCVPLAHCVHPLLSVPS